MILSDKELAIIVAEFDGGTKPDNKNFGDLLDTIADLKRQLAERLGNIKAQQDSLAAYAKEIEGLEDQLERIRKADGHTGFCIPLSALDAHDREVRLGEAEWWDSYIRHHPALSSVTSYPNENAKAHMADLRQSPQAGRKP